LRVRKRRRLQVIRHVRDSLKPVAEGVTSKALFVELDDAQRPTSNR